MSDPSDPYAVVRQAASSGHPAAAAYTAVMAAAGLGEPKDWKVALHRLGIAAEMGSDLAQGQIRLLAGRSDIDAGWRQVVTTIDLRPWAAPCELQPLSFDPQIATMTGLLPPAACRWLIDRGAGRLTRAQVYSSDGSAGEAGDRSNSSFDFSPNELDLIIVLLQLRIANSLHLAASRLEALQLLHYAPGEMFAPHCDFLAPASPHLAEELQRAGQRVATVLVYLNADYDGGETDFPQLVIRHRGQTGDALMFANVDAAVRPDPRTLHAGLPPAKGEKWLATQWIRER
jgi:prolyl 4-hydroxylase